MYLSVGGGITAKFGVSLSHVFRPFVVAYCECFSPKCP